MKKFKHHDSTLLKFNVTIIFFSNLAFFQLQLNFKNGLAQLDDDI